MARDSYAFRIDNVEPPDYSARPDLHAEFWKTIVALGLEVKDRELAEGKDRYGQPLVPIAQSTREHRVSAMGPADPNAPPLTPAYGLSRTRSLLDGRAHPKERYALFFWRLDPVTGQSWGRILGFHRKGGGRLPVRDVIGLSPAGKLEVQRRAWEWWRARVHGRVAVPIAKRTPTPAGATLIRSDRYKPKDAAAAKAKANRRIGRLEINGHVYTLQGGSEAQIRRAVANGSFSGFRQVKTSGKYANLGYGRYQPPTAGGGGAPAGPRKPNPPKPAPKAPRVQKGASGPKGEAIPPKGATPPAPPAKPRAPLELARDRQRAENAAKGGNAAFPDLIPPGPITDRLAAYHIGDVKLEQLKTLLDPLAQEGSALKLAAADAKKALTAAQNERTAQEARRRKARKQWTQEDESQLAATRAQESAAYRAEKDARAKLDTFVARRADVVAEVIQVEKGVRFGEKPVPSHFTNGYGEPLWSLTGEVKRNAAAARDWLGKITAAGDVDQLDTRWGSRPLARAHYGQGGDYIQLADESTVQTCVHEMGHLIEDLLRTAGSRAVERGKEFLAHRVGNETPVSLQAEFGADYRADEKGRKDRFDNVWDRRRAFYVGKEYHDATEILSMGLEELYNDPLNLVRSDPEFAKYLLGLLDGSLR